MGVLLDQRPSLLTLRRRSLVFVRMIHRYYSAVRLLGNVRAKRTAFAFSRRSDQILIRHFRGLPVLVHGISRRAWGLRLRRANQLLAIALLTGWPSTVGTVAASGSQIFEARYPAHLCPCLRFAEHFTASGAKLGVEWIATPFSQGSFILCSMPD